MDFDKPILAQDYSSVFVSEFNVATDIDDAFPVIPVGDHRYIGFSWISNTNHFRLTFSFYDSPSGGFLMGQERFDIRQGERLTMSIPVGGPFLIISFNVSAAGASYSIQAWGMASPAFWTPQLPNDSILYALDNTSIAATTARTDNLPRPWPGPVSWHAVSTAASWTSYIEAVSYTGGITMIDRCTQGTPADRRYLHLPRSSCRIRTTNNDASARTFFIFLSAHPWGIYG